tara:strand:+ start:372 stop:2318 length:1947 start_codon:yes stop_codon:yes gene_type:complete
MFLTDDIEKVTGKIATNIEISNISLLKFTDNLRKSFTDIKGVINSVAGYNTLAANTAREVMGSTRVVGNAIQKASAAAAKNTLLVGKGVEDNIKLYGALNNSMMRLTFFSDKQIESFQVLGFTANMSAAELGTMATSFDTLGYTTDKTLETMEGMTKQARSYGLNVSEFMGGVNKNLKLMTSYNFKDGVDGLSNMVAQAQALRIDMTNTVSFAEKLMSPETAIETAAGFQMIGGAIGKLGDPFQLLHMAQTDMEGLQKEVVNMASASVVFNEKTGEFDIPIDQMYRLREAADLAGYGYQEMTELAMKAAQKNRKLDILGGIAGVSTEQQELISNLGKINGDGNIDITMPDGTLRQIGQGFNNMTKNDYDTLDKIVAKDALDELDVAKTSMGYLNEIAAAQSVLTNMTRLQLAKGDGFTNIAEGLVKSSTNVIDSFKGKNDKGERGKGNQLEKTFEIPDKVIEAFALGLSQLEVSADQADKFAKTTTDFLEKAFNIAALEFGKFDFEKARDKIFKEVFPNSDSKFKDRSQEGNQETQEVTEEGTTDNENNGGKRRDRSNYPDLSVTDLNTTNFNITEPTTSAIASNSNLTVSGQVNLTVDNIPTSSVMTKEEFARYLINNPDAMATISSQLLNTNGTYGGSVTGGGMNS